MNAAQNGNLGNKNQHCEMKTDLNLLLECLKYQMDNPASQKEALVTICSICQQNNEASDYFREIGGLMFVNNLAKSSVECMVKEAALFTLGALAESNVFCQQTLCTSELFEDIIMTLSTGESSITLKRMAIYVVLVMVSNNKTGQSLARETGCINILLQLFRTTLSLSEMNMSHENINQCYQLWSSVCSALCACANNPQNDDNQKTCCLVFPYAKDRLQKFMRPEFVRPICSLVGLTVANNAYAQDYFASVGGLDTMAEILVKLVEDSYKNYSSAKLAVVVTKTLDACITDNPTASIVLSKYNTVPSLLALLSSASLDPGDRFSIILTLGHCTEDCEENQYDLLKNNGLPVMIQVLAESQDEEMNKAATFVLQNCRQITEKLSLKLTEHASNLNEAALLEELQIKERNVGAHWKKAKEILHRIKLLERQHNEDISSNFLMMESMNNNPEQINFGNREVNHCLRHREMYQTTNTSNENLCRNSCIPQQPWEAHRNGDIYPKLYPRDKRGMQLFDTTPKVHKNSSQFRAKTDEVASTYEDNLLMERVRRQIFVDDDMLSHSALPTIIGCPRTTASDNKANKDDVYKKTHCSQQSCKGDASVSAANQQLVNCNDRDSELQDVQQPAADLETGDYSMEEKTVCETSGSVLQSSEQMFKYPAPVRRNMKQNALTADPFTLCSDIIDKEINAILATSTSVTIPDSRCSGCIGLGASLNSRNFSKILQSCPYQCDRHKIILEIEEIYKREIRKSVICNSHDSTTYYKKYIQVTPIRKGGMNCEALFKNKVDSQQNLESILLTPRKKVFASTPKINNNQNTDIPEKSTFSSTHTKNLRTEETEKTYDTKLKTPNEKHVYSCNGEMSSENPSSSVCIGEFNKKKRRIRKEFTKEELSYLEDGVKKLGHHWNSILWSYPFQKGRTNVDLAKKYQKLQRNENKEQALRGSSMKNLDLED
ncbi:telomere repeats-binding bouquet formation protein 1 [Rhinatrema bivittatum]|uniref:telomere repeats-binding bouquet formation protein 1 n=1 Tax=Rhinatrema bivittatum TaxID=194408 RepID=UPI00112E8695|nr:telomere repeats-binding bouquet formation protein 1 [Rhinatrema bivittatum]